MQAGYQQLVITDETTTFTEALIAGAASAMYNIPLTLGLSRTWVFKGVTVIAKEQFAASFEIFATAAGDTADPQTNTWLGNYPFNEAQFQQIGGSGLWKATIYGVEIPYQDLDSINTDGVPPTLHVTLMNRSGANGKSAGAAGYMTCKFFAEMTGTNL